jgi:DNA-binding CsgD family transcriptional regulator
MSYIQPDLDKIKIFENLTHTNKFVLKVADKPILLSKREWECLSRFSQGKTYKEVARVLSLSPRTVEAYLNNIREKTQISLKSKLIDCFLKNN